MTTTCGPRDPLAPPYHVVITNACLVDGTGIPYYYGKLCLRGDRSASIAPRGALAFSPAEERADAQARVVAPGFIDVQADSRNALLFADGRVMSKVAQGVSSEILGECTPPRPSAAHTDSTYMGGDPDNALMLAHVTTFRMEQHGDSIRVGSYLGANTVGAYAMGRARADAPPPPSTPFAPSFAALRPAAETP